MKRNLSLTCKRFFNSISENVNHEIIRIFNDNLYGYLSKVEITSELEKNKVNF